jgi:hypothetical protein
MELIIGLASLLTGCGLYLYIAMLNHRREKRKIKEMESEFIEYMIILGVDIREAGVILASIDKKKLPSTNRRLRAAIKNHNLAA